MKNIKFYLINNKIYLELFTAFTTLLLGISMAIFAYKSNEQTILYNKLVLAQASPDFYTSINHHNSSTAGFLIQNTNKNAIYKNYSSDVEIFLVINNIKDNQIHLIPLDNFFSFTILTNGKYDSIEAYIGLENNYSILSQFISDSLKDKYFNPNLDFTIPLKAFVIINYTNILNEKITEYFDVYDKKIISKQEYLLYKSNLIKEPGISMYDFSAELLFQKYKKYLK